MLWFLILLISINSANAQYFSSPPNVLLNNATTSATSMMNNYNKLIDDGNATFNAFEAQIAAISNDSTPSKAIVPFNLSVCPTGWIIANGASSTPDMRGFFARATTGTPAVGTFQDSQIINHTHQIIGSFVTTLQLFSGLFLTGTFGRAISDNPASIGNIAEGLFASETRPKNVALLYCMKQ